MPAVADKLQGLEAYGILSPTLGLKDDGEALLLKDGYVLNPLEDTADVFFRHGAIERVKKRSQEFSAELPDTVLLIDQFWKRDQTFKLMFATKRDLAYRDEGNNRFQYVTPKWSTGVIMVTAASLKVYGGTLIDSCDTDPVAWVDDTAGQVTVSRETTIKQENTASVKLAFAAGAGTGLVAHHVIASINLTAVDSIGCWVRSSIALTAGDFKLLLDDTAACTSPLESIDIPAISANTWTWVSLPIVTPANLTAVVAVGLNQVVDKGAFDLYLDFIVGGDWADQLNAADFLTIGTTYSTADTWYEVASVQNDTELTLTAVYAGSTAYQQAYQARQTYTGTATDYWRPATMELTDEWLATNGVDNLQTYSGSGQAADTAGNPPKCRQLTVYEGYLVLGDVTDGGNRFPQRLQWPNHATTTGWATGDSGALEIDGIGVLAGFARLQGFLLAFSERAIDKLWIVTGETVFEKKRAVEGIGCWAPNSIIETDGGVYFWSPDNTFRFFTGFTWEPISARLETFLKNLHPDYEMDIQSVYNEEFDLCLWAVPSSASTGRLDTLLIYDPSEDTWGISDLDIASLGSYQVETQLTWDTLAYTDWDSWPWDKWDTRLGLANAPVDLMGGYDGALYRVFGADTDDGAAYTGKFTLSTDLGNKKAIHLRKRVLFVDIYAMNEGTGTLSFNISPDYAGFQALGSVSLAGSATILRQRIATDVSFFNALVQGYASNKFRFLGIIFWAVPSGFR